MRQEFTVFIVVQLALGAVSWWVGSQAWRTTLTEVIAEDLGTTVIESGSTIAPMVSVNAVVSIVAVLGVIATRAWGRRIIGGLAAIVSLAALVSLLSADFEGTLWWVGSSAALALGLILTNGWAAIRGSHWPMLGRKYERDSGEQAPTDPWKALDQGIDPTVD